MWHSDQCYSTGLRGAPMELAKPACCTHVRGSLEFKLDSTHRILHDYRLTPSSAFRCSGFRYHPDTTMRRPQHCCVSQLPLTTPVQTASKNSKRLAINAVERQLVCPDAGRRAVGDGISRRDLPRPVTDHNERPSAQSK